MLKRDLVIDCWLVMSILKTSNDQLTIILQLLNGILREIDKIIGDFDALTLLANDYDCRFNFCEFVNDCETRYVNELINCLIKILQNPIESVNNNRYYILLFCKVILQMRMEIDRYYCCNKLKWKFWKCENCGFDRNSIEENSFCQKCDLGVGVHQCFHHVLRKRASSELCHLSKEFSMTLMPSRSDKMVCVVFCFFFLGHSLTTCSPCLLFFFVCFFWFVLLCVCLRRNVEVLTVWVVLMGKYVYC